MTDSDHGPQPAPQDASTGAQSSTTVSRADKAGADTPDVPRAPLSSTQIGVFVAVLIGVAVAYYWSFLELITVWELNPNYSHGYVVPFFALGLGWVAYSRTNVLPISNGVSRQDTIRGGVEIAIGFALHRVGMFTMIDIIDVAGLIFVLLGILLAFGGKEANRAYALPVFFLIFMAPLPAPVYDPVARVLQNFASIVAVALFDAVGVIALRDGIVITLEGGHVMRVEGACSGLRSLTAILALAVAIAYLSGRKLPYCTLLVLMAAPVAIAVNCVRVFATGLIMISPSLGPEWATGTAHETEGMIMVGVAAASLALIAWMMASIEDWRQERSDESKTSSANMQPALENN